MAGDLTGIFTANRNVKVCLSTSTAISYVTSSTFSTVTTVTLGSAVLDATVTAVKYSIIQDGVPQDYNLALAESTGYGIVSGFGISFTGMSVTISSGIAHLKDGTRTQINGKTIQLDASDNTYTRNDLIYIDTQGNINCIKGGLGTAAIKGERAYTVTTNFVANDKLRLGLNVSKDLTMIAGIDFQVGTISESVSNLASALNSNVNFNVIYAAQSDNNILTVIEKTAGNYDTPGDLDVLAGSGVVTMGNQTYSAPGDANAPALPDGGILVATAFINAGATYPIIYSYERFNKDNIPTSVLKFGAIPNDISNDIGDAILAMANTGYRHTSIVTGKQIGRAHV